MEEQNTNGTGYFRGNINARVSGLEKNVDTILNNHLPHIQEHLENQDKKLVTILVVSITALLGLAINLSLLLIQK